MTRPGFFVPADVRENSRGGRLDMPNKRYKAEQIVTLLRQIELGANEDSANQEVQSFSKTTYTNWPVSSRTNFPKSKCKSDRLKMENDSSLLVDYNCFEVHEREKNASG
jgi:hypothetical protein